MGHVVLLLLLIPRIRSGWSYGDFMVLFGSRCSFGLFGMTKSRSNHCYTDREFVQMAFVLFVVFNWSLLFMFSEIVHKLVLFGLYCLRP